MPARRSAAATLLALSLAAQPGCVGPRATPPGPGHGAPPPEAGLEGDGREVLLRFARAVQGGRWTEAWPLLSERWRAATSPGRLAADYRSAGPVAREAAERVTALLDSGASLQPTPGAPGDPRAGQRLPVGPGRAARLVQEAGGWRVDALE